jgi:hypothetical protein
MATFGFAGKVGPREPALRVREENALEFQQVECPEDGVALRRLIRRFAKTNPQTRNN